MRSDAVNGGYEGFKIKNEAGCSWEGEATTSESRLHLSDILEMLIRLDQQEFFVNSVDELSAPDRVKVIRKPMCFQKMREKVHSEQYTSWVSFVEDFECICLNAMNNNQKCTKIWNAANLLFRQGKRCLEQISASYGKILGISKAHSGINIQEEVAAKVRLDLSCQGTRPDTLSRNLEKSNCLTPTKNVMSNLCEKRGSITVEAAFSFASDPLAKSFDEHVNVETLTLETQENTRLNLEDQATECSSSFSGTQSEVEGDSCEEESQFRTGNGAIMPSGDSSATSKRKKRALDSDWKTCRRGIEWRCRWLELQIEELQAEANKYSRVLQQAETRKDKHKQDDSVARASTRARAYRTRVLRRRQRRRVEDDMNPVSKHPLFSRYGEKRYRNQELSSHEEGTRDDNYIIEFDEFDFEDEYENNIVVAIDSMEYYLWQIEALQMNILELKNQLLGGPMFQESIMNEQSRNFEPSPVSALESPRNFSPLSPRLHSPSGLGTRSVAREFKGGGNPSRRRNSDFDINNVIMPDAVMTNYVEPVRHAFITTPQWRRQEYISAQHEESSSEEETDDEIYKARHAQMQMKEMQQHYTPLPLNRSRSISFAKQRPKIDVANRRSILEDATNAGVVEEEPPIPTLFGYIPKRKRRRRVSRDIAVTANISQALPNTESNRVRTRSRSSKYTNNQDNV